MFPREFGSITNLVSNSQPNDADRKTCLLFKSEQHNRLIFTCSMFRMFHLMHCRSCFATRRHSSLAAAFTAVLSLSCSSVFSRICASACAHSCNSSCAFGSDFNISSSETTGTSFRVCKENVDVQFGGRVTWEDQVSRRPLDITHIYRTTNWKFQR